MTFPRSPSRNRRRAAVVPSLEDPAPSSRLSDHDCVAVSDFVVDVDCLKPARGDARRIVIGFPLERSRHPAVSSRCSIDHNYRPQRGDGHTVKMRWIAARASSGRARRSTSTARRRHHIDPARRHRPITLDNTSSRLAYAEDTIRQHAEILAIRLSRFWDGRWISPHVCAGAVQPSRASISVFIYTATSPPIHQLLERRRIRLAPLLGAIQLKATPHSADTRAVLSRLDRLGSRARSDETSTPIRLLRQYA